MDTELFLHMPIAFQGLVVESTTRCNARCGMCYQSAGPKGSDLLGDAALTAQEIKRVIDDALQIESLTRKFHLAGGEAFLNANQTIDLFAHARRAGFIDITTTTNAYWARTSAKATEITARARKAGLTRMEISWDFWHMPYIPAEAVINCLRACRDHGIATTLRLLTTTKHLAEEALAAIPDDALEAAAEISSCPVFPTGRAATSIPREEIFHADEVSGSCHSVLHLTVNGRGNVYPCCAGADQTTALSFGNIRDRPIHEIATAMNQSDMLRVLVFLGPQAILDLLPEDMAIRKVRHANICHACWEIFSDPVNAAAVSNWFNEFHLQLGEVLHNAANSLPKDG